jgi:hypothetical protein
MASDTHHRAPKMHRDVTAYPESNNPRLARFFALANVRLDLR